MLNINTAYTSFFQEDVFARCKCAAYTICWKKPTAAQYGKCPSCKAPYADLAIAYAKELKAHLKQEAKEKAKVAKKKASSDSDDSDSGTEEDKLEYNSSAMNKTIIKVFQDKVDPLYNMHKREFKEAMAAIGKYAIGETHKMVSDAYEALEPKSEERRDMKNALIEACENGDLGELLSLLETYCDPEEGEEEAEAEEEEEEDN